MLPRAVSECPSPSLSPLPAPPSQNVPCSLTLTAHAEPLAPPGILPRKGDLGLYHRDRSQEVAPPQDRPHWSHLQTHHRTTPSQSKINAVKQKNKNQKKLADAITISSFLWTLGSAELPLGAHPCPLVPIFLLQPQVPGTPIFTEHSAVLFTHLCFLCVDQGRYLTRLCRLSPALGCFSAA